MPVSHVFMLVYLFVWVRRVHCSPGLCRSYFLFFILVVVLFILIIPHLVESLNTDLHIKAANSRYEPVLCRHITDSLTSNLKFYLLLLAACHKIYGYISSSILRQQVNSTRKLAISQDKRWPKEGRGRPTRQINST